MGRRRPAALVVGLATALGGVVVAGGCTEARLYGDRPLQAPDEVTLQGSLCTADPTELRFPVKVLFLVDTSVADGDYVAQRGASLERVVRSYGGANYSFAVIRYAGQPNTTSSTGARPPCSLQNLTPDGFTKSLEDAVLGVQCAAQGQGGRDLQSALSLASAFLTGDILTTPLGLRSRTKYVVVLLANGPPTVPLRDQWCRSHVPAIVDDECVERYYETFCGDIQPPPADCERAQYVQFVIDMKRFSKENGVQELFFQSVYQRDLNVGDPTQDDPGAIDLLQDMAIAGEGSLYRFGGPAVCDDASGGAGCLFSQINLDSTQSVFQRRQLIVSNRSVLVDATGLHPDSDGDGLTDEFEAGLGTDPLDGDTDGDHLSDRLEFLLESEGLDPLVDEFAAGRWPVECPRPGGGSPDAFPPEQDLDGDRLTDCEENLLRSERTLYDSDADGIPDPLEFRYGTNIISSDPLEDVDADGRYNVDEYRAHLDPLARDINTDKIYRYEVKNEALRSVMGFSQPFGVTGVYITQVSEGSREGRAILYYEPNPPRLSWKDPQDTTPSGADPGRGDDVGVGDGGTFVLHSKGSDRADPATTWTVTVEIYEDMLPTEPKRDDVRLHRSDRFCFDWKVTHVKTLPTLALPDGTAEGTNYVDVFLSEVPTNNPTGYGIFRVATIPVISAGTPLGIVEVRPDDFLFFGD